jgi:hypothetical protein
MPTLMMCSLLGRQNPALAALIVDNDLQTINCSESGWQCLLGNLPINYKLKFGNSYMVKVYLNPLKSLNLVSSLIAFCF